MPRRVLLMRHATAERVAPTDTARPLSPRGREEAPRVAAWLAARGFSPRAIVASPALRAQETARLVADALRARSVATDDRLYLADADALCYLVAEVSRPNAATMLVGHNPGMAEAVVALANDDLLPDRPDVFFPPASAAVFDLPEEGPVVGRSTLRAIARAGEIKPPGTG